MLSRLTVSPIAFALTVVGFALATFTRADADLWGHLRFGLDSLRDGGLTTSDPYSFTQDKPWVNHEWLSELLMAVAYQLAGATGLIVLKASLLTVVLAIVWSGLPGVSAWAKVSVYVALAFGTIHMSSSVRPQLWTLLGIAILARVLVRGRPRDRWWLPLVFAVWVNCHGGWIVGLGVLGAWAAGDVWSRPERWRTWMLTIAASAGATLVNPYGWGLWLFMAETVRMSRDITEWKSLWGTPVLNWIPWFAATLSIPWVIRAPTPARWSVALVLTMLAYASARVMRIESLFATAAAILLGPHLKARWPARPTPLSAFMSRHARWLALAVVALVVAGGVRAEFRPVRCIGVWGVGSPDQRVLPSLRHAEPGRIVTYFDWGQYALWHLGPALRVSMDGRRETVYSDFRLAEHNAILAGTAVGFDVLAEWDAEYVWLPVTAKTTAEWLRSNGYRIDVDTGRSFVAVRSDLPTLPPPPQADVVLSTCFPG